MIFMYDLFFDQSEPQRKPGFANGDQIADAEREMYKESDNDICHSCYDPLTAGAPRVTIPLPVTVHPSCAEREKRKK